MLCEICHVNEADISYSEIVDGETIEHNICSECAQKEEFSGVVSIPMAELPFVQLLTGLLAAASAMYDDDNPMRQIVCPTCGMGFDEFVDAGKFGCAECYSVFGPLIEDNMKKIHGDSVHRGKVYSRYLQTCDENADAVLKDAFESGRSDNKRSGVKKIKAQGRKKKASSNDNDSKIFQLKSQLQAALAIEDYDEAARLRDEIKKLQ